MSDNNPHLETLNDIRNMMQRSSRFISLSGLSGLAAGCWALAGAGFAYSWMDQYYRHYQLEGYSAASFYKLKLSLLLLAVVVLALALLSAFYFTWRRAGKNKVPLWDHSARRLTLNMVIPLVAGGLFILSLLQYDEWRFVTPACLIFYGLALVNGSKYTLGEVRYLGLLEIVLGLVSTQFPGKALFFWAGGFGLLHMVYGFVMWWRYERETVSGNNQNLLVKE
ncbi:MAG: hypothetical protein ACXVMS_01540 [Flavisolibacter sp.]